MATKEQVKSLGVKAQKHKNRKKQIKLLKEIIKAAENPLSEGGGKPMFVDKRLFFSLAFWSLRSATAIKVYFIFLTKCQWKEGRIRPGCKDKAWHITNNGKIQFTYRMAQEKYEISRGTFRSVIDQLVEVGLIDIAKTGMGLCKDVSLYAISERWQLYGTDKFVKMKRPKCKRGCGFVKGNTLGKNTD